MSPPRSLFPHIGGARLFRNRLREESSGDKEAPQTSEVWDRLFQKKKNGYWGTILRENSPSETSEV